MNLTVDWPFVFHCFQMFASIVIVPTVVSLIKSECLALDNSTQANGLVHWYRLAKQALATAPAADIKAVERQCDAFVPGSSQIIEAAIGPKDSAAR